MRRLASGFAALSTTLLLTTTFFLVFARSGNASSDIGSNSNPRVEMLGHLSNGARVVTVQGNYAYIGNAREVAVVDVSAPTNPRLMGKTELPDTVNEIVVSGTHLYVAAATGGLRVLDVSDPEIPVEVGSYARKDAQRLALTGTHIYVVDAGDLVVVDVSDPASPMEVGTLPATEDTIKDVELAGQYAYLATQGVNVVLPSIYHYADVKVVDVSNPANPIQISAARIWPSRYVHIQFRYFVLQNRSIYLALQFLGIYHQEVLVDISNPTDPQWSIVAETSSEEANSLALVGDYVYAVNEEGQLHVLDNAKPLHPVVVGSYDLSMPASTVETGPGNNVTVGGPEGLSILRYRGGKLEKRVNPDHRQAAQYGEVLTYTLRLLSPSVDRTVALSDTIPTHTIYRDGSLNAPSGIVYDSQREMITGTAYLHNSKPVHISYAVTVLVTGTAQSAPWIVNQVCAQPLESGTEPCDWVDRVEKPTLLSWLYLPFVSAPP